MPFDDALLFSLNAVRRASIVTRRVQAALLGAHRQDADATKAAGVLHKDDQSPVTVADFASQAVVARALREAFPGDALVGEEDASALRADPATLAAVTRFVSEGVSGGEFGRPRGAAPTIDVVTAEQVCEWIDIGNGEPGDRFWTLDPIDGTKGFLRCEQYAVALALIVEGRVEVAALACPALGPGGALAPETGIIAAAVRGQGAFWMPLDDAHARRAPLRVSTVENIRDARFLRSVESGHTNLDQMGELAASLGVHAPSVGLDSQAKYAVMAGGHGDVLLRLMSPKKPDYRECIWDQAAGSLVVEEAGGRVTDLDGRALDFSRGTRLEANRGVCATNGALHDAILSALATMSV